MERFNYYASLSIDSSCKNVFPNLHVSNTATGNKASIGGEKTFLALHFSNGDLRIITALSHFVQNIWLQ